MIRILDAMMDRIRKRLGEDWFFLSLWIAFGVSALMMIGGCIAIAASIHFQSNLIGIIGFLLLVPSFPLMGYAIEFDDPMPGSGRKSR